MNAKERYLRKLIKEEVQRLTSEATYKPFYNSEVLNYLGTKELVGRVNDILSQLKMKTQTKIDVMGDKTGGKGVKGGGEVTIVVELKHDSKDRILLNYSFNTDEYDIHFSNKSIKYDTIDDLLAAFENILTTKTKKVIVFKWA